MPYLLLVALWIYALVDCLGTPPSQVRGLPKVVWLLIVMLLGWALVGPLAWLFLGKRRGLLPAGPGWQAPYREQEPEPARPWIAPDDNPEFLRALSERIQRMRDRRDGPPSEGE
ncbi:PLD nuclease N-terminal domain-containing protein [Actinacidiphila acididurans]|nr:PLD nuclease N-terminal domain-containing protein [Actinacidiphila acididurans]